MKNNHIIKWKLYARTGAHKYRVNDAIENIKLAGTMALKWGISWSGGKDSTALVHLVKSIIPEALIISQIDDCDWPEKKPYIDRIAEYHNWEVNFAQPDFSVQDALMDQSVIDLKANLHKVSHSTAYRAFVEPLHRIQKKLGLDGFFMGLRAAESKARKINFIQKGNFYKGKDGFYRCLPLGKWKAIDSFAYLVNNDIDINPCYFQNRFLEPEDIRTSWAIPTFMTPCSTAVTSDEQHIKYYYPEIWEKLKDRDICH